MLVISRRLRRYLAFQFLLISSPWFDSQAKNSKLFCSAHGCLDALVYLNFHKDFCSAGTVALQLPAALDPVVPQPWSQLWTRFHPVPCVHGIFHAHPFQTQPNPWVIPLPFLGKSRSCEDVRSGAADESVQLSFQTHDETGCLAS